jgi:nucleoside phosphorylase
MMHAVILTALPEEFNAVHGHLINCTSETYKGTIYEIGTFTAIGSERNVAVAEIGQHDTTSAIEAERAITHFTPHVALFVGVAGGLKPKDLSIGDVVAASKAYGYESGKAAAEFKPRPEVFQSSYHLVQLVLHNTSFKLY